MTRRREGTGLFLVERGHLVKAAAKSRLPAVYAAREFVDAGGLTAYGANISAQFRRAATYVNKILKGRSQVTCPSSKRRSSSWS
jgi:putative ABC transport system substrate-binding protein